MKVKNIFRFVFLIAFVFTSFVSCDSDESKSTVDEVTDTVKDGAWRISYFYDSGKDKTANYVGYNFIFGDNTVMTASREISTSYNGQWFVTKSTSDNELFSTIFKISMSPTDIFQDLNEDWKVIENTGTSLTLKDDSQGQTAIDYLTFQKIE